MKVTFLGGGALRVLETVDDLLRLCDPSLELRLVFQDLDLQRATTVAKLSEKMPCADGRRLTSEGTTDLDAALDGARFVYLCIRHPREARVHPPHRVGRVDAVVDRDGPRSPIHGQLHRLTGKQRRRANDRADASLAQPRARHHVLACPHF